MTQGDDLVPVIVRREGVKRDESATFGNFEMNDGFDGQMCIRDRVCCVECFRAGSQFFR